MVAVRTGGEEELLAVHVQELIYQKAEMNEIV